MQRRRIAASLCWGVLVTAATGSAWADETPSAGKNAIPDHPIVPAFERFYTGTDTDDVRAGQLLLGELGCTACHAAEGGPAGVILRKQAPVLDNVADRVRPEFLQTFISDPQQVKPGTTMPNLFAGMPTADKQQKVEALTHFLAAGGTVRDERADRKAVARGEELYHRIGCVACHDPQRAGRQESQTRKEIRGSSSAADGVSLPYSVPLGDLAAKYTVAGLTRFLRNPHQVRPSGRMPSLNLGDNQAKDIASFLLRDVAVEPRDPNVRFAAYEGSWQEIPEFEKLKPYATGKAAAFDLTAAGRTSNFGLRFDGFLHVKREGRYTFHLGSDDGSRLVLDGKRIVNNDGIHAHQVVSGSATLAKGPHPIRVDYIQGGGEWTLALEYEGPGVPRQPVYSAVTPSKQPPVPQADEEKSGRFVLKAELVEQGRRLFAQLGCASCHQKRDDGEPIASAIEAPPLAALEEEVGCLSENAGRGLPDYSLSKRQRETLAAALSAVPKGPPGAEETIARTLAAFNCYACHRRNNTGGVPEARDRWFQGTIPEMGDEGRIPPHLDGVGDKLRADWLIHVLAEGADDRPYMHVTMPRFGKQNVGHLAEAFVAVDRISLVEIPEIDRPPHRVKSIGRHMVGEKALSCIKCHNFGKHRATGIQSIDLQTMTRRLREDWYQRYMLRPQDYRPGTRMPTAFPAGQSVLPGILEGSPRKQLRAIWTYLADGSRAATPDGLLKQAIVLVPKERPIIYRNFIEGLSPRGIAVGYPEKAHLAFDAGTFSLALIWHGRFIDASQHWRGRGQGSQRPLGDHVLSLVRGVPFAAEMSGGDEWPDARPKELGYRFEGYRLDQEGRPVFRYRMRNIEIEDFPEPVPGTDYPGLRRTLTLRAESREGKAALSSGPAAVYYRAAAGTKIERLEDDGWYLVDEALRVRVNGGGRPFVRRLDGHDAELLVPVEWDNGQARIVQTYVW